MRWDRIDARLGAPGERLIVGMIPVGVAKWDMLQPRDGAGPTKQYKWRLDLPGRARDGAAASIEDAKAACEAAFHDWTRAAGLQFAPAEGGL